MPEQPHRRRVLTGLAVGIGSLSGCVGQVQEYIPAGTEDPPADPPKDPNQNNTEDPDESEPTDEPDDRKLHHGETIPMYPYAETKTDPLNPQSDPDADNPVLTAADVDDVDAAYVYDPFLFVEDDEWHMFFTVRADGRGRIAYAKSDDEGVSWEYDRMVLNLRNHVSFPNVFKWDGSYYMTVQQSPRESPVSLYKANSFPHEWYRTVELFDPTDYDHGMTDRSLFRWDGRWWCIGGDNRGDTYLYYSDELDRSGWEPHEQNPVVSDRPAGARPGGRPIVRDSDVLMFFRSLVGGFGSEINAYRITELTPSTYEDSVHPASPLISGTNRLDSEGEPEWNADRMHQFDPWYLGEGDGWRIAVDGDDGTDNWSIGIYRVSE